MSARDKILDLAEAAVLTKGYGATSIDELIAGAGITKSGFFYHFREKGELAKALMSRDIERDEAALDAMYVALNAQYDDPLDVFLVGMEGFAEATMAGVEGAHPGCVLAALSYQDELMDEEGRSIGRSGAELRFARFRRQLDLIAARHPPRIEIDLDELAMMALATIQGGIVLNKVAARPNDHPAPDRAL